MRLSFADAALATLDALSGVEAACLFVFEDERPLRGLAGFVDWRLCGALSRILTEGKFVGAPGDALLFPVWGRLGPAKLFCFGAGRRRGQGRDAFGATVKRACEAMSKAGVKSFATFLPPLEGAGEVDRARAFLAEGAASFKGERIVLFGDARALCSAFRDAAGSMKGLEIDHDPLPVPGRHAGAPAASKASKAS
ncbi:MAG TPA: M17 family peptidase N-terminal domain-containing protein [Myxococcales bacterium]